MQKQVNSSNRWTVSLASGLLGLFSLGALSGCISEKTVENEQALIGKPLLDQQLVEEDFAFPSRPPRLSQGKAVFQQNCATCHTGASLSYNSIKDVRPIDNYLMLTRGDEGHPAFEKLTRDQRWEAVFYARYLAGEANIQNKDIASIFGANCAVCHGGKGFADGPLHTGHASAHELGMAPIKNAFDPPPANFHSYSRMYNRTNDELVKFISEGIYPSAMPSWKGRQDKDKGVVFNDALILDLVKYVRAFAYENDLPPEEASGPSSRGRSRELSAAMPGQFNQLEKR